MGFRAAAAIEAQGFGIAFESSRISIKFDWGDHGEPDGFDAARLWDFYSSRNVDFRFAYAELDSWLMQAWDKGELERDSRLFYDPRFRAAARNR